MCLIVKDIPEDLEPLTAEKDIYVYKVLNHRKHYYKRLNLARIFTPYMLTPIEFNFWGKCIMEADMDGKYGKKGDNVSYIYGPPKLIEYNIVWENGEIVCNKAVPIFDKNALYLSINAGIHAYVTRKDVQYQGNLCPTDLQEKLHKAVIPKGAHYFIGSYGDIVADKMIIYRKTIKK